MDSGSRERDGRGEAITGCRGEGKEGLADISRERFGQLVLNYNNTPHKCLGYYTPAETFANHLESNVLHLKC